MRYINAMYCYYYLCMKQSDGNNHHLDPANTKKVTGVIDNGYDQQKKTRKSEPLKNRW